MTTEGELVVVPLTRAEIRKELPTVRKQWGLKGEGGLKTTRAAFGRHLVTLTKEIARQLVGQKVYVILGHNWQDWGYADTTKNARMKYVRKMKIVEVENDGSMVFDMKNGNHYERDDYIWWKDDEAVTGGGSDRVYVFVCFRVPNPEAAANYARIWLARARWSLNHPDPTTLEPILWRRRFTYRRPQNARTFETHNVRSLKKLLRHQEARGLRPKWPMSRDPISEQNQARIVRASNGKKKPRRTRTKHGTTREIRLSPGVGGRAGRRGVVGDARGVPGGAARGPRRPRAPGVRGRGSERGLLRGRRGVFSVS
jgi:hypothetical protein